MSSLKIFPAKTTKLRLIAIRLRETNHLIHLFSTSVANYRLRCYVWSGNEGGARERRNSGSRLHSFPGKSGEVSTSIGVSRFLWRPRSNHSKPPFTRETEEGEGGDVGREWAEACAPLDVRGMKWNDDAWLIRCRPPTRIDNRVIRDNPPFLIEFQISLSLSICLFQRAAYLFLRKKCSLIHPKWE